LKWKATPFRSEIPLVWAADTYPVATLEKYWVVHRTSVSARRRSTSKLSSIDLPCNLLTMEKDGRQPSRSWPATGPGIVDRQYR
jgi:hypothetical protein